MYTKLLLLLLLDHLFMKKYAINSNSNLPRVVMSSAHL